MLDIKTRQKYLKQLGIYLGSIDGILGPKTIAAYIEFQKRYGLTVDGKYGPLTNNKLIQLIKGNTITWNDIKYFKKSEFNCPCGCGKNNIDLKLVKVLDDIRRLFGSPIKVTCGTRCKQFNSKLKGAVSNSKHLEGKAADIVLIGRSKQELLNVTKQYVKQGKARYTYTNNTNMGNAVHIDIN